MEKDTESQIMIRNKKHIVIKYFLEGFTISVRLKILLVAIIGLMWMNINLSEWVSSDFDVTHSVRSYEATDFSFVSFCDSSIAKYSDCITLMRQGDVSIIYKGIFWTNCQMSEMFRDFMM